MRLIVKHPGSCPEIEKWESKNILKVLEYIVGGEVKSTPIDDKYLIVYNETNEYKKPNIRFKDENGEVVDVKGTAVILRYSFKRLEIKPVEKQEVKEAMDLLKRLSI